MIRLIVSLVPSLYHLIYNDGQPVLLLLLAAFILAEQGREILRRQGFYFTVSHLKRLSQEAIIDYIAYNSSGLLLRDPEDDMAHETRLLKQSALMMLMVAVVGIAVGVWTGSEAILFDGMFSLIATLIKLLMVLTARLIKKEYSRRFQFGFWHLEPMVLTTEGIFIGVIALYALLNGVQGLLQGGTSVEFGGAILYALLFTVINFSYYFYVKKRNQRVQSTLVAFDNISWFVDALLALGLLISFTLALLLTQTQYAWLAPYVDPALLVVIALAMLPSVAKILRPALTDMLRVAPVELNALVEKTMKSMVEKHHIIDYHSYCQNDGRISIVEINILMGILDAVKLDELDAIREEIQAGLDMDTEELWLTVSFTRDRKWLN